MKYCIISVYASHCYWKMVREISKANALINDNKLFIKHSKRVLYRAEQLEVLFTKLDKIQKQIEEKYPTMKES
jgi:hypothetical protein